MWPFGQKKVAGRLAAARDGQPASVRVLTTVVSPNVVTSPVSGLRSALLQLELLERIPIDNQQQNDGGTADRFEVLGVALFGEVLALRDQDGDEVSVVAGRASLRSNAPRNGGIPITRVPPELVPFLRRATGRGVVCYRELMLVEGDQILLKATVEPSRAVVASGYRSASSVRYVTRDDLAPVMLEEVFEAPDW